MGASIIGGTTGKLAEVESNHLALRTAIRPPDIGALGSYRKMLVSGTIAAGMSGPLPVFAARWAPTPNTLFALLRRVSVSIGNSATAFTAGFFTLQMFAARAFTSQYTTNIGTTGTFTGNNAKLKTGMATSAGMGAVILGTSASGLTTATSTLDTDPMGGASVSVEATAGKIILPPTDIYRPQPGEWPFALANAEGFEIQASPPATGTWKIGVVFEWDEVTAYP